MMGNISWYLLFSIKFFGKVEAQPIHIAHGVWVKGQGCGRQDEKNSGCAPEFVF